MTSQLCLLLEEAVTVHVYPRRDGYKRLLHLRRLSQQAPLPHIRPRPQLCSPEEAITELHVLLTRDQSPRVSSPEQAERACTFTSDLANHQMAPPLRRLWQRAPIPQI